MTAIEAALPQGLARLDRDPDHDAIVERAMKTVRDSGPSGPDETSDHSDLYDENGMPA
jgi:antitoxin VapB